MAWKIKESDIRAEDANGTPIAGAKLFVFESGSTVPQKIFFDPQHKTPAPNPLEGMYASNSGGYFPEIHAPPAERRLVCVSSDGILLWENESPEWLARQKQRGMARQAEAIYGGEAPPNGWSDDMHGGGGSGAGANV